VSYTYVVTSEDNFLPGQRHATRHGWRRLVKPSSLFLFRRGTRRHARYRANGDTAVLNQAIRDLSEAVWGLARYPADVDSSGRRWGTYANNLGVALLDEYWHEQQESFLKDALAQLEQAVEALPTDSPERARALVNLIEAVETRLALKTTYNSTLPDLTELRRELSGITSAPTSVRLDAAKSWGYAEVEESGPEGGLPGLAAAVELLPLAAWWGHTWGTRERLLADYSGLATDAAACAIAAGEPARALELLEGGRAVLWKQLLTTRTDRTELRAVAPRLAKRMDRVAAALERDHGMPADQRMALVHRWSTLDNRANAKLRGEWESLTERAENALPDGTFGMPTYADLRPAGAEGPVVIVNVSDLRCDALIVHGEDEEPQVVELPDLDYHEAGVRTKQYATALAETEGREQVVSATLDWLWRVVAAPVLDALDLEAGKDGPRLWWCPTGALATLPLHAAARYPLEPDEAVQDRVISSYTPTVLVLLRARHNRDAGHAAGDDADRRLLHVTIEDGPGRENLPGVARTRAFLEELVSADRRTQLDGSAATAKAVEAELGRHVWVHFDCHGVQDLDNPSQGGLVLHDRTLTVADLAGVRRDRAEFAFLAACTTAIGGRQVPDEAIALTSALQYAGYQHVIGTLWSVPDRSAARITQSVYGELIDDGWLRPADSARALRDAVRAERRRLPQHPSAWVPFLHVGL
jgi:CHAT domain-containing protein